MTERMETGAHGATRAELLALTSALRCNLEELEADRSNATARAGVGAAGRGLTDAAARHGIEPLCQSSQALAELSGLGRCLDAIDAAAARGVVGSLLDAVGILEQSLEAALAAAPPQRLQGLTATFTETWPRLAVSAVAIDRLIASTQRDYSGAEPTPLIAGDEPAADELEIERESVAVAPESEFLDAFIAEAAESFERCEDALLALEQNPSDSRLLAAFADELHTIRDAATVVGLSAATVQLDAATALVSAVQSGSAAVDDTALVDFLLRLIDSVKGLIDQACGDGDSTLSIIVDVDAEIAALCEAAR